MVGGGAVVVLAVVVFLAMGGQGSSSDGAPADPKPVPSSAPSQPAPVLLPRSSEKAGKEPTTPPPALTQDMLKRAIEIYDAANALCNEGVKLRTDGNNIEARKKQSEAKAKIDEIKSLLAGPIEWQESAELEGWRQPGEYVTLANFWSKLSRLSKKVRMSGGT